MLFWREEGGTVVDVTVPFNTRVALKLPSGNRPIVCNGQTVETAAGEDGYRTTPVGRPLSLHIRRFEALGKR